MQTARTLLWGSRSLLFALGHYFCIPGHWICRVWLFFRTFACRKKSAVIFFIVSGTSPLSCGLCLMPVAISYSTIFFVLSMTEELRNSLTVQYMLRGLEEMLQSKNSQYVDLQELTPPPTHTRRAQAAPCQAGRIIAQ